MSLSAFREHLINALIDATSLVIDVVDEKLDMQEFVERYSNFYYSEALDGHEADGAQRRVLNELSSAITFHRKIQYEVINIVSFEEGDVLKVHLNAGRISSFEAKERLKKLNDRYSAKSILNGLNIANSSG